MEEPKRKRGGQPRPDGAMVVANFRLARAEMVRLRKFADARGTSLSATIRNALLAAGAIKSET